MCSVCMECVHPHTAVGWDSTQEICGPGWCLHSYTRADRNHVVDVFNRMYSSIWVCMSNADIHVKLCGKYHIKWTFCPIHNSKERPKTWQNTKDVNNTIFAHVLSVYNMEFLISTFPLPSPPCVRVPVQSAAHLPEIPQDVVVACRERLEESPCKELFQECSRWVTWPAVAMETPSHVRCHLNEKVVMCLCQSPWLALLWLVDSDKLCSSFNKAVSMPIIWLQNW